MSVLNKIISVPLAADQYFPEETKKTQIYVHHTAGSSDPYGVFKWWASTPDRIATSFIIGGVPTKGANWKDGDIIQCFSSKHWGWHLGLKAAHLAPGGQKAKTNTELNKMSIGIEICNWGQLTKTPKGFKNYAGGIVSDKEVVELTTPFKGFKYYHRYTQAQLDNTAELITFLGDRWQIPVKYLGDRIFGICPDALQGASGLYTHVSVRPDKWDVVPQPDMIAMLKSL